MSKQLTLFDSSDATFFGGIAGWELALQLAGFTGPVWTGSCPCQPYSAAGKGLGDADERNLWPEFFRLICECRPEFVFGEQVESAIRHGWLDGICRDLEGEGYAVGACVLGAHSVGAPHIRQRLYWGAVRLADDESTGLEGSNRVSKTFRPVENSSDGGMGNADDTGPQRRGAMPECPDELSAWSASVVIPCSDGKSRRIGRGVQPLAYGIPRNLGSSEPELRRMAKRARANRVGRLKGYGNAIVPQVAAEFVRAFMDSIGGHI